MDGSIDSRGAQWGKWDLHVHTPASLVHHYPGPEEEAWEAFLSDLEALPPEFTAIGINDYWFLDGYKRVLQERANGRLANIAVIFPVLEMRLEQFGGTEGHLRRINLHVLFDPKLDVDVIEQQFLNVLSGSFKLDADATSATWGGAINRKSLTDLGRDIKATVPETQRPHYDDDLMEGFNNLNVSMVDVERLLDGPYLRGRALIGLGKTEWSQIKWNNSSIASKKSIINKAHFVFTAYQDVTAWSSDVSALRESQVTSAILDCSDAHYLSGSDQNERLGACATWLHTSPSFEGLKHALSEFDRRVFVGLEPTSLAQSRIRPEVYLDSVRVTSEDPSQWNQFDYEIPLNEGFIAIVGTKGQGKSALLDSIALAGNSDRENEYAFLTRSRFLSPSNKAAKEYFSEVAWKSGVTRRVQFSGSKDEGLATQVEYLPQRFVERICTVDPFSINADDFERELRDVLFTHIPESDRAAEVSFDALLAQKTAMSRSETGRLQAELAPLIERYIAVAEFRASMVVSDVDARIRAQRQALDRAKNDLRRAEEALASTVQSGGDDAERDELRRTQESVRALLAAERMKAEVDARSAGELERRRNRFASVVSEIDRLEKTAMAVHAEIREISPGVVPSDLVDVVVGRTAITSLRGSFEVDRVVLADAARVSESNRVRIEQDLEIATKALVEKDAERELARQHVEQVQARVAAIEGQADKPDTLAGLEDLRRRLSAAPADMASSRKALLSHVEKIYNSVVAQLDSVRSMYAPAATFISNSPTAQNAGLQFDAGIRIIGAWRDFANFFDGRKSADLGTWIEQAPERLEDTSWLAIEALLQDFLVRVEGERGDPDGAYRNPASALRAGFTIERLCEEVFALDWLEVRFGLTGEGRPLAQLSPGQRGLILALFYLVVDRRRTPLLLDQPEENLDNETIALRLVPAIHEAAGRRQTIVVTHNANLAIVGDADQIIHCVFVDGKFRVDSGHISELAVATNAVNILEGTKPAFDNRREKYGMFPGLS